MKYALPRMTSDPSELPSFFKSTENLFRVYDVPVSVQSKLLLPLLTDKAKSLVAKLTPALLDKYTEVRDFLLREFRLSSEQYRDKFLMCAKLSDETYTLFGTKLKNLFEYYIDSRQVTDKDDLVELMVTDRIKRSLPDHCLKHVLTKEAGSWLKLKDLTQTIDVYTNSQLSENRLFRIPCSPR